MTVTSHYIQKEYFSTWVECADCGLGDDPMILFANTLVNSDVFRQAEAIARNHNAIFPEHHIEILVYQAYKGK